ncbi:spermatogenesis-associated protein 7 [Mytilus galloprovincialis]|uniref:Spermatogenesis-associated protein 7 n=2 Tax=Mytilus galloprovincialis TaxID=29158 RepID=A0A8B6D7A4_MYTGA|nr:spermatogenesis-associated protein 7 [Mytilus galloprovincialis]
MGVQKTTAGSGNMQTMKGQLGLRSSALAPTSSKITTQYLVLDHMNNHYRKVVGAKSAIDNKPPKALKTSQKIRDRQTRDYVKKTGTRPPSRTMPSRTHSQMQYYDQDDYDDENQWGEYDPDDEEERLVQTIMRTTLKPKSSTSVNATHGSVTEPTERQYEEYAHTNVSQQPRAMSANSKWMKTRNMMTAVRAVTAPISARKDKTYDGDLIEKRSHAFTEEKPFTPRTLKTKNRSSRLSEYKYYTPPPQKRSGKKQEEEDHETKKKETPAPKPRPRQSAKSPQRVDASMTDTLMFESLQSRDFSRFKDKEELVPKLDISLDKDHMNWLQEQQYRNTVREKSGTLRSSMGRIQEDEMMHSTEFDQTRDMSTLGKSSTRGFGNTTGSQRLHKEQSYIEQRKREREEELKYMEFMKEVTDDVLTRGVFTNRVLKQVFESHIRKKKGQLDERRMRSMLGKVRNDLGILDDDESDLGESYRMGETVSTSSFKLRPTLAKFEHSKVSDVTFDSTVDSQNTYKFKSTSSADMYSTIHSEPEDLSASQALRDYQMKITRKEEMSEGEVTPEESESLKVDEKPSIQPKVIQVISKEDDNVSVHSRVSKARSTGKSSVHSHVSKATSVGKKSEGAQSSKQRSQPASQHDDDTLTERSQNRTENDQTDEGEYGEDEFESDGDF